MSIFGIREKGKAEAFTIMAMVEMSHDGEGPSSEMHLSAWSTIVVGDFGLRRTLFSTRDFVFAAELLLFGDALDFKESFQLYGPCAEVANRGGLEIFDVITGETVPLDEEDERLKEFTSWRGTPVAWAKQQA